jgi:sterol desaturase/sphingolipid hydroxylase (fatty acid hydroxylase superfamily)
MFYAKAISVGRGLTGRLGAAGGALAGVFLRSPSSPWLPVGLYGPVAVAGVLWNLLGSRPPAWAFLVLPVSGVLLWTFIEYVMHSEAFHRPTRWGPLRVYQESHLGHHDDPKDPTLIVARLSISLPLAVIIYALLALVLWNVKLAALPFAGVAVGYLAYEVFHYGIHRWRKVRWLLRPLVKHHLYHHYKDQTRCFGVTTTLWDWVFRTNRQPANGE